MNSEELYREVYEKGFGNYLGKRVKDRMDNERIRATDLSRKVSDDIGFTPAHIIIGLMRNYPSRALPVDPTNPGKVSFEERLRRVAVVLNALKFDENDELISGLRMIYGDGFVYPPKGLEKQA